MKEDYDLRTTFLGRGLISITLRWEPPETQSRTSGNLFNINSLIDYCSSTDRISRILSGTWRDEREPKAWQHSCNMTDCLINFQTLLDKVGGGNVMGAGLGGWMSLFGSSQGFWRWYETMNHKWVLWICISLRIFLHFVNLCTWIMSYFLNSGLVLCEFFFKNLLEKKRAELMSCKRCKLRS